MLSDYRKCVSIATLMQSWTLTSVMMLSSWLCFLHTLLSCKVWCSKNSGNRPVLKHGLRSLTYRRAAKCKIYLRNEIVMISYSSISRDFPIMEDTMMSRYARTRKMVNYSWAEWSQGKLWWKFVALLTCKSFAWLGYRGERLIEPSSSWFPPKFPLG